MTQRHANSILLTILAGCLANGCSLEDYRLDADREAYDIVSAKASDPRWSLPEIRIEPAAESRLHDPGDPDHPPMPPDDPAAHSYMLRVIDEECWKEDGEAPIEDPRWRDHLKLSESGRLDLSVGYSVELALLHSREYQSRLEDLYLAALDLTLERFDFSLQWFGGNFTGFEHSGSGETERNELETSTGLGFSRSLSAGGQLLVDVANSFVWEFSGSNSQSVSSNIALSFIQPLLRGAGRRIRLEQLTQSERNVLYVVREFARFRKRFYVDVIVGSTGFLPLLLRLQGIRNLETTVRSLEENLRSHEALAEAGVVSRIQVDQVFQGYQRARLAVIRAENDLQNELDAYKVRLGLPPTLPVNLDDALLASFQLEDPALTALQGEIDRFLAALRESEGVPSAEGIEQRFVQLRGYTERLIGLRRQVENEHVAWEELDADEQSGDPSDEDATRERSLREQVRLRLTELEADLQALESRIDAAAAAVDDSNRAASWEALRQLTRQELLPLADLSVMQTQIRVYLIRLPPVELDFGEAVERAWEERLDLMNERARVVDAWRRIKVSANGLESDVSLLAGADIGTEPGSSNPVKFSRSGSRYRVGLQIDGPLNRLSERNEYRASLIDYQRARRSYMRYHDEVAQQVRRDLRRLKAERINFELTRQSLITAARQVELAREQLLAPGLAGDSSSTQDVLDALNSLLDTKNSLISTWISYETNRLQLLLNLEALKLDETGLPLEEFQARFEDDARDTK